MSTVAVVFEARSPLKTLRYALPVALLLLVLPLGISPYQTITHITATQAKNRTST